MIKQDYDAIVVGAGPNGLAAAITMQHAGLSVLLIEAKDTVGGGLRTKELTLPGFKHDVCSAIHPMAAASPFFQQLPLHLHGLEYIYPSIAAAHPFDNGRAAVLTGSIEETAQLLGKDEKVYTDLINPILKDWPLLASDILGPLQFPEHPVAMAKFGLKALTSASFLSKRFLTGEAKGLWAGMAAHSMQPLSNTASSAIALVLLVAGHAKGWPIPKGGSQSIANALSSYFVSLGGEIQTGDTISNNNTATIIMPPIITAHQSSVSLAKKVAFVVVSLFAFSNTAGGAFTIVLAGVVLVEDILRFLFII